MRFRKELILVPLACLVMAWVLSVVNPACEWGDITNVLNVHHEAEYGKLAVLGVALIALVTILRVLRG